MRGDFLDLINPDRTGFSPLWRRTGCGGCPSLPAGFISSGMCATRATNNWIADLETLPDLLPKGSKVVIVGCNPSPVSARIGRYYAGRGNQFWSLVPRKRSRAREVERPLDSVRITEFGIGLTDIVKRPSKSSSDVSVSGARCWTESPSSKAQDNRSKRGRVQWQSRLRAIYQNKVRVRTAKRTTLRCASVRAAINKHSLRTRVLSTKAQPFPRRA